MADHSFDGDSDQRGRVFVVYAGWRHHTGVIADAIAARIRSHGLLAEVGDVSCGMMPPPQDYDAIVLGSVVGFASRTRLLAAYIRDYRQALADVPAALFTVSASGSDYELLSDLVRSTGWRPAFSAAFAGGMRTDWSGVDRFADKVAASLDRTEPYASHGI